MLVRTAEIQRIIVTKRITINEKPDGRVKKFPLLD